MNIKEIMNSYNEFRANYYMNDQMLVDNDANYKIAEAIATKEAIKIARKSK